MLEFTLAYAFILDFDNSVAMIYDGGDMALGLYTTNTASQAVVGLLKPRTSPESLCNFTALYLRKIKLRRELLAETVKVEE